MDHHLAELEVGCGQGQGSDGLAVGTEAARQAVASINGIQGGRLFMATALVHLDEDQWIFSIRVRK